MYKNYLIFPNSSTEIPVCFEIISIGTLSASKPFAIFIEHLAVLHHFCVAVNFSKNIINFALFTIYKKSDKIIENEKLDFYKINNSIFGNF